MAVPHPARSKEYFYRYADSRADLQGADLQGADLQGAEAEWLVYEALRDQLGDDWLLSSSMITR